MKPTQIILINNTEIIDAGFEYVNEKYFSFNNETKELRKYHLFRIPTTELWAKSSSGQLKQQILNELKKFDFRWIHNIYVDTANTYIQIADNAHYNDVIVEGLIYRNFWNKLNKITLDDFKREINNSVDEFSKNMMFIDRKSTRLNSSHIPLSRMPSSA